MSHFIPFNTEDARNLEEELAGTFFKSSENLVELYNAGIVNKSNDMVSQYVDRITKTYKDVKEKSKTLIFLTQNEVYIEEIVSALEPWRVIVKLKKLANEVSANGTGLIVFNSEKVGVPLTWNDETLDAINNDRLFYKFDDIKEVNKIITGEDTDSDVIELTVDQILNLDDSFIEDLYSVIPNI